MLRLKPLAWWVLPWGMLAGVLRTLVFLGQMGWKPLSDCGQMSSPSARLYSVRGGCATIDEGYPVRFLSTVPGVEANPGASVRDTSVSGVPVINKGGLAEDWFIWSAISCLALYIVSPARTGSGRYRAAAARPALGPGHPSGRRP
jgi:hypothetical protein